MPSSDLRGFVVRFLVALVGLAALWPLVSSSYHWLVEQLIQLLFPGLAGSAVSVNPAASSFGLALFIALMGAVPRLRLRQRLLRAGLGLTLLAALQVLSRTLTLQGAFGLSGSSPYPDAWLLLLSETSRMLWPILLWAGLTFRAWFPRQSSQPKTPPKQLSRRFPRPASLLLVCAVAVASLVSLQSSSNSYAGLSPDRIPVRHFANASGQVESNVKVLNLQGLKTRFRTGKVTSGTREAIAMAVGICDRGVLVNTQAQILPQVASSTPAVAGGLRAIPCVSRGAPDRLATGVRGARLSFRGSLAKHLGTVRMYVDLQGTGTNSFSPGNGKFFEEGELVTQTVPEWHPNTQEAIVRLGSESGQVLTATRNTPVATVGDGTSEPMVLLFTVDINAQAPPGSLEVALGLTTFDDTAQGSSGPCQDYIQNIFGATKRVNCGSNFMHEGPALSQFKVKKELSISSPKTMTDLDTDNSGLIETKEMLHARKLQQGGLISTDLFLQALSAWTNKTPITSEAAAEFTFKSLTRQDSPIREEMRFIARGQGIRSLQVTIYNLNGQQVFGRTVQDSQLTWSQTTKQGTPVANGVYLYRAKVTGMDGRTVATQLRKLLVLR